LNSGNAARRRTDGYKITMNTFILADKEKLEKIDTRGSKPGFQQQLQGENKENRSILI